jgi:hypothetical protein
MMTTLFLIFVALVVLHFIIEGIIAPSERSKVRLELFALRDRVRHTKIDNPVEFDDELYDHMQEHVNRSIHLLHNYNLAGVFRAIWADYKKEPSWLEADAKAARFYELLGESKVEGLDVIHRSSMFFTLTGAIFNTLGWLPYVFIPGILVWLTLFATRMFKSVRVFCRTRLTALLEMPDPIFEETFPSSRELTV